jgi:hypothetical protein
MKKSILSALLVFGLMIGLVPAQLRAADAGSRRLIEAAIKAGELDSTGDANIQESELVRTVCE